MYTYMHTMPQMHTMPYTYAQNVWYLIVMGIVLVFLLIFQPNSGNNYGYKECLTLYRPAV